MNRKELTDRLELVGDALATNDLIPIYQCFCFDGETVTAYNDSLAITAPIKTDEEFAVNGKILLGLLKNNQAETAEFAIAGNDLTIKSGRSVFKLPWFPKADFLFNPPASAKTDVHIQLDFADLIEGFKSCLPTTGGDAAAPAFRGICLNGAILYSTDGDAISRYTTLLPYRPGSWMLPVDFCRAVIRLVGETYTEEVDVSQGYLHLIDEWIIAELASGYTIYGRYLHVDNPLDHQAEINKTLKGETLVFHPVPKGLDLALSRACILTNNESAKTVLKIAAKKLNILTSNSLGTINDNAAYADAKSVEAHVSAELVQRCLGLCDEMAVFEHCCCFSDKTHEKLFILTSNME